MSFETYHRLYDGYAEGTTLRAGGSPLSLSFGKIADGTRPCRLFVVGETALFFQWKDEPDMPAHYRTITDALDTAHADRAHYCLNLSSKKPEKYIRRVYKKVIWPPVLSYLTMHPVPEDWTCGIRAKAENLRIEKDGFLRMRVEIRHLHEGVNRHSVELPPDETHIIDFPEGTWDWRTFSRSLVIPPEGTAHVGVWLEGVNYSGSFYLEGAFLTANGGVNTLPDFDLPVPDKGYFDWTAQYLSRKEWPEFEVMLNGEAVFRGEVFERCHLDSEWEIDLPAELLKDKNELTVRLVSDYHDPVPYIVREIGVIEQTGGTLSVLAASPAGTLRDGARVLIKTGRDNVRARFVCEDGSLTGEREYVFDRAGLHGVKLGCARPSGESVAFSFLCEDGTTADGAVSRVIDRTEDGVVTGTGDMIYVEQRADYVEEYLSWYISNGVGNLLTIRPTYRWSGTRMLNPEVWETVTRVLNEMDIRYVLMIDGRELPGMNTNPDNDMLAGKGFNGAQTHERDGAAYYWGIRSGSTSLAEEQWGDMVQQVWKEDPLHTNPDHAPNNYFYNGDRITLYRDPNPPHDNRLGAELSIAQLARTRGGAPRHTGPSVMFKYLMQAGYDWVGAETMYGSMEPLMAFLRGARLAAGRTDMGVHHAVQWSSSPEDAPEHFRRYRLALYVSYMQGATEINTEEGLWHLEECYSHFHRFSEGCKGHLEQQQDFYRYLATHTRAGRFSAPVALLHGRYDGWHAFGNHQPWGWADVKLSDAEKSWDLLKVFYPLSKPGDALYIHGCDTDHAVGYHTGMPMGNVDVIPAESGEDLLSRYGALAYMGYHCAAPEDFDRLTAYVKNGGRLLLTRAHMTTTTLFDDVAAGRLAMAENHPFLFCKGEPRYVENHVGGIPVTVCANADAPETVLAETDEGLPFAGVYAAGGGQVLLVNALAYPAHPAVRPLYEKLLSGLMAEQAAAQPVWTETGDDVGSAVWTPDDGSRHVYLLAVDWFRPTDRVRTAVIRVGGDRYTASMPFGVMVKAVAKDGFCAWPHSEDGEVLSLENGTARVQGTGRVTFTLAHGGAQRDVDVDFGKDGVKTLDF